MPNQRIQPYWPNGGPGPCRIAIVGEAPGDMETYTGRPFVGPSGQELDAMLAAAGINRAECLLTNVVMEQPEENNFALFCVEKEQLPPGYTLPPIITEGKNLYLHPDRLVEGQRLRAELDACNPNVVIALGGKACWAMLGNPGVAGLRGVVHRSTTATPRKVVATWHPASVLRQWNQRPVAIADLVKAEQGSHYPDFRYDNAELWLQPSLNDLYEFERRFIRGASLVAADVETARGEITCLGFSPDNGHAICVPFRLMKADVGPSYWKFPPVGNYWPTPYEEKMAWLWCKRILEDPRIQLVGQNFLFDIQQLLRYGIKPRAFTHDLMLAHHTLYPELPKDLGFMGSIHTNHPQWKDLAGRHTTEEKKDA